VRVLVVDREQDDRRATHEREVGVEHRLAIRRACPADRLPERRVEERVVARHAGLDQGRSDPQHVVAQIAERWRVGVTLLDAIIDQRVRQPAVRVTQDVEVRAREHLALAGGLWSSSDVLIARGDRHEAHGDA
jgi:hypothetical protein